MTRIARIAAFPILLAATLGACQQPARRPQASAGATTACRAEVDRVYAAQNRGDLSSRDERDSPLSANYLSGITTQGLGARYGRDNMMGSCLDNASNGGKSPDVGSGGNPGPTFNPVSR